MSSRNRLRPRNPRQDELQLQRYEREYQKLRRRLARTGYLIRGSLALRSMMCGQPSCRCRRTLRFRHGPYYWWTSKVAGKTVTRMLSEEEGVLYMSWIGNRQRLDELLEEMYEVSAKVARLKLGRVPPALRKA